MGIANRKPAFTELLQFIGDETKKWSTILQNLQGHQNRDFNVHGYVVKELEETEARWRGIRTQRVNNFVKSLISVSLFCSRISY